MEVRLIVLCLLVNHRTNYIINDVMKKYLIIVLIEIFIFVSCDKKEDSITYEFMSSMIDTLVIGKPFAPSLFITSPPAKVTFYLEGPIKDSKKKVGNFLYDNTSDSLYISDDMLFIQEISSFEKNNYNKKYWADSLYLDSISFTS